MPSTNNIHPGSIVTGPTLSEPIEVLATVPTGSSLKIIGRGRTTGMTHDPVLTPAQIAQLQVSADREPFDGDARMFRLGVEAHRLGLAYEYDPFFSLLDIAPAPQGTAGPASDVSLPDRQTVEQFLYERTLAPWGEAVAAERLDEAQCIQRHVEISLNSLIDRGQFQLAEYLNRQIEGQTVQGLDGLIAQAEQHLDTLNNRLDTRRQELELERHSSIADIKHLGRAWVTPHPGRSNPDLAPMVRDDDIERIAVEVATRHEEQRGWVVESVEDENRSFDLISRRPHPEDAKTFIEVKGRAGVGVVALSENEYRTAERLKNDFWLYAVFNCAGIPELHVIQNPARLGWQPVMAVEHYQIRPEEIRGVSEERKN